MDTSDDKQVRGRPRNFDRQTVLDRAMRVFWARGYAATSISDLTEAMGIGAPSLYATFGSKASLYAEAIKQYQTQYQHRTWAGFWNAATAREAIERLLLDSAIVLTGSCSEGNPLGCMVTLSAAESEGYSDLGKMVITARNEILSRLNDRLSVAVTDGEIDPSVNVAALARYVAAIQNGMSIHARDGATRNELENVARVAMIGWDAQTKGSERH